LGGAGRVGLTQPQIYDIFLNPQKNPQIKFFPTAMRASGMHFDLVFSVLRFALVKRFGVCCSAGWPAGTAFWGDAYVFYGDLSKKVIHSSNITQNLFVFKKNAVYLHLKHFYF